MMSSVFRYMWLLLPYLLMHPVTTELEVSHLILCLEKPTNVSEKIKAFSFLLNRYYFSVVVQAEKFASSDYVAVG